jgi:4-hydroxybenzoate polyprenyltransferase
MKDSGLTSNKASTLCVDLDGTLIRTDLLAESALLLLKSKPWLVGLIPLWMLRGRAYLKRQLASRVQLPVATLPFREDLLEYLRSEHKDGRELVLATASDSILAQQVADHLKLFSKVIGSDSVTNVKGEAKTQRLIEELGGKAFVYAGNSKIDMDVWKHSAGAVLVDTPPSVSRRVQESIKDVRVFPATKSDTFGQFVKAIRVHQWVKNLLIFAPIIAAHQVSDTSRLLKATLAFAAFSLCASAVYLLNDLVDLEADRQHPRKCRRPFASGSLPLFFGFALFPLFFGMSFWVASLVGRDFVLTLLGYAAITTLYSFYLKRLVLLDVIVLAGLYTLRIIAGLIAPDVPVSHWLLAFAMFIFLSLALSKRFSELHALRKLNKESPAGRGYRTVDLEQLASMGSASGYISVLVLALYIQSKEVTILYEHPQVLWLICPAFFYWISRVWLLAHRGYLHEDPVVFALKDKASYLVGAWIAAAMAVAT